MLWLTILVSLKPQQPMDKVFTNKGTSVPSRSRELFANCLKDNIEVSNVFEKKKKNQVIQVIYEFSRNIPMLTNYPLLWTHTFSMLYSCLFFFLLEVSHLIVRNKWDQNLFFLLNSIICHLKCGCFCHVCLWNY